MALGNISASVLFLGGIVIAALGSLMFSNGDFPAASLSGQVSGNIALNSCVPEADGEDIIFISCGGIY